MTGVVATVMLIILVPQTGYQIMDHILILTSWHKRYKWVNDNLINCYFNFLSWLSNQAVVQGPVTDKSFTFRQIILIQHLPQYSGPGVAHKSLLTWCDPLPSSLLRCSITDCMRCNITRVTVQQLASYLLLLACKIKDWYLWYLWWNIAAAGPVHVIWVACRICPDYVFFTEIFFT